MKTRALLVTGVDALSLGDVEVPEPGPGEILLEAAYTGVSPGTELRALAGKQEGMPPFPFVPGYAFAGRVVGRGEGATLPVGTAVFCQGSARIAGANRCWGGHIAHAVRAERDVLPLPEGVSLEDAALLRLAAIAYHGVRLSRPQPHETVAVVGLGPVGQLSARLHALTGARVVATDLSESRCVVARAAGVEAVPSGGDLVRAVRDVLPDGADVVVDASGAPAVLPLSARLARDLPWDDSPVTGTRLVVQGSYPGDVALPYGEAFGGELTLLFPRSDQPRDLRAVADLLQRGRLTVADLLAATPAPEDAPAAYARLRDPASGWLTFAVRWS